MTEIDITADDGGGRQRRTRFDYPGNSQRGKTAETTPEERPKQEKIITGEVRQRKTGIFGKAVHSIVAEDGQSVMQYVVLEVLLPAFKSTISDVVSQGIERMLYGDARPGRTRPGYTNYSSKAVRSSAPLNDPRPALSRQARANHRFNEVMLEQRAEAEDVLDKMREIISAYDVVTVADFKELLGITGEFTDNTWGWSDLRSAGIRPVRGGYVIDLPPTQPLA